MVQRLMQSAFVLRLGYIDPTESFTFPLPACTSPTSKRAGLEPALSSLRRAALRYPFARVLSVHPAASMLAPVFPGCHRFLAVLGLTSRMQSRSKHSLRWWPEVIPASGMARGPTYPVAPEKIIVAAKSLFTCFRITTAHFTNIGRPCPRCQRGRFLALRRFGIAAPTSITGYRALRLTAGIWLRAFRCWPQALTRPGLRHLD